MIESSETVSSAGSTNIRILLAEYVEKLRNGDSGSWGEIYQAGEELLDKKRIQRMTGLFKTPPRLMTATIDDSIGQGLRMIHLFSRIAGLETIQLGLMQTPETIISECKRRKPDLLGLTVLQFDTEDLLDDIIADIPNEIQVIAGGPVFKNMSPDMLKDKKYRVLNHVSDYLDYLLELSASYRTGA